MTDTSSEIACDLTEPEVRERKGVLRRTLTPFLEKTEYAAGTELLVFSKPEVTRETLQTLMKLETECCPFLSFELAESDTHFELTVTGPNGSEDMVREFFGTSNSTPCGCSAPRKKTGLTRSKYVGGALSLCVLACAAPPLLAAFGLVGIATSTWLGRGLETVVIGVVLSAATYYLFKYARKRRQEAK